MKAIGYTKFGSPEVLQLQEVKRPEPKELEVRIRIYATTVAKEDPDLRASPGFNGFLKPRNPIQGQEPTGEVEAVNRALTVLPFLRNKGDIQNGQQVLINGASGSVVRPQYRWPESLGRM